MMKTINKLINIFLPMLSLAILTGCAAGAATAGYALKAQSADSLTAEAEQKIVERTKREILSELYNDYMQKPCSAPISL
jgi:hypothetical protein